MKGALQLFGFLLAVVLAYGAWIALAVPLKATSPLGYIGSLLAVGLLGLVAQGVAEHVLSKDRPTDPLAKRVGRLLLALILGLLIFALINWVFAK